MAEYIEREATIELIRLNYCKDCNSYNGARCRACSFDDAMLAIEDVPSADVVEVRHGEWKMRGGLFRCSVCDGKALFQDVGGTGGFSHEYEQVKSSHCPNCLAKMDGNESGNTTKIDK